MSDPRFLQDGFDKRLAHFIEECGEALSGKGRLRMSDNSHSDSTSPFKGGSPVTLNDLQTLAEWLGEHANPDLVICRGISGCRPDG